MCTRRSHPEHQKSGGKQMTAASPAMMAYFQQLDARAKEAYEIAKKARSLGFDPEFEPEIPQAVFSGIFFRTIFIDIPAEKFCHFCAAAKSAETV